MTKLQIQATGIDWAMRGVPNRWLRTRKRLSVTAFFVRASDTLPVVLWSNWFPVYWNADFALRFYLAAPDEPLQDEVQFDTRFAIRNFGITGTPPNEILGNPLEDYVRTPTAIMTQNGYPSYWEMPAATEEAGRNFTHISLGVSVDVWNPTFDHFLIGEVWGNAFRPHNGTIPKLYAMNTPNPDWDLTQMNLDVDGDDAVRRYLR